MRQTWHIDKISSRQSKESSGDFQTFIPDGKTENGLQVHLDGYIIPRMQYFDELKHLAPLELIRHLRAEHGKGFIHYLKGTFCILLIEGDGFEIYTDRHGIQNFFTYSSGPDFIISNSLAEIANRVKLDEDVENAAAFTLLSHFIGPATLYCNVTNSEAGSYLEYREGKLTAGKYWQPEELVAKGRKVDHYTDKHFANAWKNMSGQYLCYLKPSGVSLTITSGNDSRMVLSSLLAQGIQPHTFTFGNPASFESVVSAQVAKAAGLGHTDYFVEHPSPAWMERRAEELMRLGSGMISIQRAHRLDAYEREKLAFPGHDMLFTGLMGGEYLKMSPPNSAAIPQLLREAAEIKTEKELDNLLTEGLLARGFRAEKVNIPELSKRIRALTNRTKDLSPRERDFVLLYLFYGCAHHSQEARVLGHIYQYPVHMFMDVDFLQLLASSADWYPNNAKTYNRLTHSRFMVSLTHLLAPQLSRVPYGKRGQYNAEDMLFKPLLYLLKRLRYLVIKERKLYPAGFIVGRWMHEFCGLRLDKMSAYLDELYDLAQLKAKNELYASGTDEYSWQIISNPINIGMVHEHYTQI